jgi:hypothetical protein
MIVLKYDAFDKFQKFVNESEDLQKDPANLLRKEVQGDVSRCVSKLIGMFPFFGEYLLSCRFLYGHPDVPTMATDGKNIFINEMFASKLSDKQMQFILAHEVLHCVLQHHLRMADKLGAHVTKGQANKWNYAADYEINPMLVQEGIITKDEVKNVLKGLYEDKYLGQAAEPIYDDLGADSENDQETPGDGMRPANVGDPISTPSGDYGVITKIHADGSFEVDPLTKEEAYELAKSKM